MKIIKMTTYKVAPRWLFLKVETDEGITGWGEPVVEGRADTVRTAVEELSGYFIGKDPMKIEDHWQTMYRGGFYRGGPEVMSAISGIDQALWDIKGKFYIFYNRSKIKGRKFFPFGSKICHCFNPQTFKDIFIRGIYVLRRSRAVEKSALNLFLFSVNGYRVSPQFPGIKEPLKRKPFSLKKRPIL